MAAAELKPRTHRRSALDQLLRAWPRAYAAVWTATLSSTGLVAISGAGLKSCVRQLLGLHLNPASNPPPDIEHVLALAAHNVPIASWPLLLGVVGAHKHRLGRRLADTVLLAWIIVNTMPVGAALGAYGLTPLPYLPQLPLEWAGLALGLGAWSVQRGHPLTIQDGLALLGLIVLVLVTAAAVEVIAVPHR
jgi:hypothetical protein